MELGGKVFGRVEGVTPSKGNLTWVIFRQDEEREREKEVEADVSPSAVKASKVPKPPEVSDNSCLKNNHGWMHLTSGVCPSASACWSA